jgi:hypothetical protein
MRAGFVYMKSQDILLLLKIFSTSCEGKNSEALFLSSTSNSAWQDWSLLDDEVLDLPEVEFYESQYSLRELERTTGVSKSQISLSMRRCEGVGLLRPDRKTLLPSVNMQGLSEFIFYGLGYVFPAKPMELTRGITTGIAAPVLQGKLFSSGDLPWVWSDARGKTKGQSIEPIYKTVPFAVKRDPLLYALLALVDSIRCGNNRERKMAFELFQEIVSSKGVGIRA